MISRGKRDCVCVDDSLWKDTEVLGVKRLNLRFSCDRC
ncbi:unnamed protein product [Tenebrio molitor]|nr:unnamed protein product [Tenebrio molitor]